MNEFSHESNQLWFWNQITTNGPAELKNKKYHTKVLTLDKTDYTTNGWGNLLLEEDTNGGENQIFHKVSDEIVSKWDTNLKVKFENDLVGCAANPQMWEFKGTRFVLCIYCT